MRRRGISASKKQREKSLGSSSFPNSHMSYSLWHQRVQQCNAAWRDCDTLRASKAKQEYEGNKLTPCLLLGAGAWALSRKDIPSQGAPSAVICYWKQDQAAFLGGQHPAGWLHSPSVALGRVRQAVLTQAWSPPINSLPQHCPPAGSSFPACLPRTALPIRQSQAAAPSASCFPATCCPFWWSSWWAFLGFHPIGLSLPPRWWYVLTGASDPWLMKQIVLGTISWILAASFLRILKTNPDF